ncbi:MAG TPA: hypothetical protein VFK11_01640 [Candidatus Saccharimonadales bacterium]|nr:hypothetical protein [Candidatus Saccharimonadales bacterium]
MAGYSYLDSLAREAVLEAHRQDDYEMFAERDILATKVEPPKDGIEAHVRIPLGIMGRFLVGGDGAMSKFVYDEKLAKAIGLADIEDCARAGQYLLENMDWPIEFDPEEVERFAKAMLVPETKTPFKLLAGVQVSYDSDMDDLVPTLVYDRNLGGIAFDERAVIAGHLIDSGRSVNDVADATHYEGQLAQAVMRPTERNVDFFAETAAQSLVVEI